MDPGGLFAAVDLLDDVRARDLLQKPTLRSAEELRVLQAQMFALHWRLREYGLRPQPLDFETVARECWFGPLDITGLRLIDGDLALGDQPISAASQDAFWSARSTAQERQLAVNWLVEGGVFSETDIST